MKLAPKEYVLQDAIRRLRDEDSAELVRYIGKLSSNVVWFENPAVVEKASGWVEEKINKIQGFDYIPPALFALQSALKLFQDSLSNPDDDANEHRDESSASESPMSGGFARDDSALRRALDGALDRATRKIHRSHR